MNRAKTHESAFSVSPKLLPLRPRKNMSGYNFVDHHAWTNEAKCSPSGHRIGQNGADFHMGTIKVPLALQFWAWLMVRHIKYRGGTHQFTSFPQFTVKVSTAMEPVDQNRLWNLESCAFSDDAKQSTTWGPHIASNN